MACEGVDTCIYLGYPFGAGLPQFGPCTCTPQKLKDATFPQPRRFGIGRLVSTVRPAQATRAFTPLGNQLLDASDDQLRFERPSKRTARSEPQWLRKPCLSSRAKEDAVFERSRATPCFTAAPREGSPRSSPFLLRVSCASFFGGHAGAFWGRDKRGRIEALLGRSATCRTLLHERYVPLP